MRCTHYISNKNLKKLLINYFRWGIPKGLGLRGGGENSLNTGTSGWGIPTASGGSGWGGNPPGPPQGQWGGNRPPGQTNTNSAQQQG